MGTKSPDPPEEGLHLVADCRSGFHFKLMKKVNLGNKKLIKEAHILTGYDRVRMICNIVKEKWRDVKIKEDETKRNWKNCKTGEKFKRNSKLRIFWTKIVRPFSEVGNDCVGLLPGSSSVRRFIVLVAGCFKKWVEGRAFKQKSTKEIARFLVEEIFERYGMIKVIRSDKDLEFINKLVDMVAEMWELRFRHSSSFHLQFNGLAERKFESPYVDEHFEVVGVKGQGAYQLKNVEQDRVMNIRCKDLVKVSETERVLLYLRKGRMLTADRLN